MTQRKRTREMEAGGRQRKSARERLRERKKR